MLGGHPGFKIPLYENEKYTDYQILFETTETTKRMCVVDGFLANKYEDYLVNTNKIELSHNLFIDDALVFKGLKSKYIDIVSKNHNKKIRFYFRDFEILAIWSKVKEDVNLLCLEPWNGIQKEFVIEHEKMGVLEIMPNSYCVHSYKIEVI
jgi:galactose mutarotase-like enzyme